MPANPLWTTFCAFLLAELNGKKLIFLARHGNPHCIPPHKINYRANIWGLKHLGVTNIIGVAAVGGITNDMKPGHIAIPDQIIDYTYGREHTFFADDLDEVTHIDFTLPYSLALRERIIQAAEYLNIQITDAGVYGCTQGPRLETAAEIVKLARDGCDLVGMTGMPEAALAKELGMSYANISVVANWGAGLIDDEISMSEIERNLKTGMAKVVSLLQEIVARNDL